MAALRLIPPLTPHPVVALRPVLPISVLTGSVADASTAESILRCGNFTTSLGRASGAHSIPGIALRDSHISKAPPVFDGMELNEAAEHDDGSRLPVIACPSAEAGVGPEGDPAGISDTVALAADFEGVQMPALPAHGDPDHRMQVSDRARRRQNNRRHTEGLTP